MGFEVFLPVLKYMGGVPQVLAGCAMVIASAIPVSIGAADVPSVGLITLPRVFNAAGLPLEGVVLIMGFDCILDTCRTAVSITVMR